MWHDNLFLLKIWRHISAQKIRINYFHSIKTVFPSLMIFSAASRELNLFTHTANYHKNPYDIPSSWNAIGHRSVLCVDIVSGIFPSTRVMFADIVWWLSELYRNRSELKHWKFLFNFIFSSLDLSDEMKINYQSENFHALSDAFVIHRFDKWTQNKYHFKI